MKHKWTMTIESENEFELEGRVQDVLNAGRWRSVVWDLDNGMLRQEIKYGNDNEKTKYFQEVRDKLYELLRDQGLEL